MRIQNIARLGGSLEGCDCEDILQRLTSLEENQWDCSKTEACLEERLSNIENNVSNIQNNILNIENDITNIKSTLTDIQNELTLINTEISLLELATEISGVRSYKNTSGLMNGLGAAVISIGPTYNYWGIGTLVSSPTWGSTRINLIVPRLPNPSDPNDEGVFPELFWYQGDTTVSTVWFTEGGTSYPLPLFIDATGIYIRPTSTLHPSAGTTFSFTQTLILTPPTTPTP